MESVCCDIIEHIIKFISPNDLLNFKLTSKKVNRYIDYFFKRKIGEIRRRFRFYIVGDTEKDLIKLIYYLNNGIFFSINNVRAYYFEDELYWQKKLFTRITSSDKRKISWMYNDHFHRSRDKPAYIEYHKNGKLKTEKWFLHGKICRENGKPTIKKYYKNGNIKSQFYTIN